jgi:hypothetical protein
VSSADRPRQPGPGFRDWALFALSFGFTAIGAFMLFDRPRDALMPLTFFGVCAISAGFNIGRKLRRRRFTATSASVPGGVRLTGSKLRMLLLAAGIAIPAIGLFVVPTPVYIRVCGAIMFAASGWLLFMVVSGRISRRFLRFDPPGLTVGEPGFEYFVPWDEIVHVGEFELVDNASVGFRVRDPEAIVVTPAGRRRKMLKGLANNEALSGRHVVFMAAHYNVPAEALCAAIRNYAQNPAARAELVPLPALTA